MERFIESLASDPGIAIGTVLGSLGIIGVTVICVSAQWRKVRQAEELNSLKREMLQAGMSADEIAHVVSASPKSKFHGLISEHARQWHGHVGDVAAEEHATT